MSGALSRNKLWLLLAVLLLVLATPSQAHAYIGPGAGFAVVGSFLVMFTAMLSGVLALFTWPVRYLIRANRRRRAFARSRIKRFVVLGLDGMDPGVTQRFLEQGKLPNLERLRQQGCFKPLATTVPSISPVAWSSFQTGVNPGKHNIFDFLTRDKHTYGPKLSSVEMRGTRRKLRIGEYAIPLGKPDTRLLRKGKPFWKTLGEHGIFSSIIRVPITFPPEKFYGVQLSGMCVPDLRGTQGMFSFYTTGTNSQTEHTGGQCIQVTREGNMVRAELLGCGNPLRKEAGVLTTPFTVTIRDCDSAQLQINGSHRTLKRGHYSDWLTVNFKAAPGVKVRGICKFLLLRTEPELELYVTPINIDPDRPAMPIAYPSVFSTYLSKLQGPFATLGLVEDSWALNERVIDDDQFIRQCLDADNEREKMFFDALEKVRHGLCVCVFDGTDRIQHTFWRDIDEDHPARRTRHGSEGRNAIEQLYQRMDQLVGRTLEKCKDDDTVLTVISDHGFSTFRRGVDLNRWLEENGYLTIREESRNHADGPAPDFSKTQAFAVGLAGIYLNLKGRETHGIVEPDNEAPQLREEIAAKLTGLIDPENGQPAVKNVYNARKVYTGPYKDEAPDLLVGYHRGYRASWDTAVGKISERVFQDNTKAWSGDHCIDPSLVPGVLFCNRAVATERPRLMDIGPTVLRMFGIEPPPYMDGRALEVADVPQATAARETKPMKGTNDA